MLYKPEDFEPLVDEPWDAERIGAGIREIVADADGAYRGPMLQWRADEGDRWRATSPLKTLYNGSAGVLWALDDLRRRGHAETGGRGRYSLWTGDLGVALYLAACVDARPAFPVLDA